MAEPEVAPYQPTQEVRFAVVLYGGSSLAIYINGVVQELLHLVRATAPADAPTENGYPDEPLLAEDKLLGTEKVYRTLGRLLSWEQPGGGDGSLPDESAAITTRFVVDILSGTSAGGINGIFLAKALANEVGIDQLRDLWFNEGDMKKLLYDDKSYEGVRLEKVEQPPSLLNSRRMYWELLSALKGMSAQIGGTKQQSRLVDELDLWITATDIYGLAVPIDLWDRTVYEKRHRNVFRFSYANAFASDVDVPRQNDFEPEIDPLLAFAARCTSAVPFAFEPMQLADVDGVVKANPEWAGEYGQSPSQNPAWERFFKDYVPAREEERWYTKQSFGDGGYLDNKPFTWATSGLMRRRADLPVDRKLIYVEPDPGTDHVLVKTPDDPLPRAKPRSKQVPLAKPDALENTKAAALELPRAEPIRDDLQALLVRNRDLARIERIRRSVDDVVADDWRQPADEGKPPSVWKLGKDDWLDATPEELAARRGLQYLAYHELKIVTVLDELAEAATILAGFDPDSDERTAIRCFVQGWYELTQTDARAQNQFLLDFDLPYRLRRLAFLQDRIDQLLRRDERALEILAHGAGDPESAPTTFDDATLIRLKRDLNGMLTRLRDARRALRARDPENPSFAQLQGLGMTTNELMEVLSEALNQDESDARAREKLADPDLKRRFDELAGGIREQLVPAFAVPENDPCALLESECKAAPDEGTGVAVRALLRFCKRYEAYDSVTLPIAYGAVDEADRVEVIRVSPEDATGIVDELAGGCRKLGGIHYGHFGGFLKRKWRENDYMWGRLDAADRLLTALLPGQTALQERLKQEAFHEILREERPDEDAGAYIERLKVECAQRKHDKDKTIVRTEVDREAALDLIERAAKITHKVLDGVKTNLLTRPIVKGIGFAAGVGAFAADLTGKTLAIVDEGRKAEHWLGRLGAGIRKRLPFGRK
jgi:patatin-related protein